MGKNVAVERIKIRVAGADDLAGRIQARIKVAVRKYTRGLRWIIERRVELSQHAVGIRRLTEKRVAKAVGEGQVRFHAPVILCVVFELVVHDVCRQVEQALRKGANSSQQEIGPILFISKRAVWDSRRCARIRITVSVDRIRGRVVAAGILVFVVMIIDGTELEGVPAHDFRDVSEGRVVAVIVSIRSKAAGSTCESSRTRNPAKSEIRYASQRRCERQFHRGRDIG